MIEIYKDALDLEKFYDLLKLKQQVIIKDYNNESVRRGTHESSTFKLVNTEEKSWNLSTLSQMRSNEGRSDRRID